MQQHSLLFPIIKVLQRLEDGHVGIQFVVTEGLIDSAIKVLGEINRVVDFHNRKFSREGMEQGVGLVLFCKTQISAFVSSLWRAKYVPSPPLTTARVPFSFCAAA